jgi:hypothetical protein
MYQNLSIFNAIPDPIEARMPGKKIVFPAGEIKFAAQRLGGALILQQIQCHVTQNCEVDR